MKKLCLLLLLSVLIFSCKKNKDKNCGTDMASIAGSYKETASTYKASASAQEQDLYALEDACEKDDIITLNVNGNYTYADAGVVCSPAGDGNGTWSVTGTSINLDGTIGTLVSYDCKTLVISIPDIQVTGDVTKITLTRQ
jgi:hypothetical protein